MGKQLVDCTHVDSLLGNMLNSVQSETSIEEGLKSDDQAVLSSVSTENFQASRQTKYPGGTSQGKEMLKMPEEDDHLRKERKKKDNHNIIERRRRYNINDRIKELGSLLPASVPQDLRQNKGSILKASVEYMKELISDKHTMQKLEENQQAMNSKFQKLLVRIFQLELKMKLYGLSEDFDNVRVKKKKKPKKRLSDINAMVDDFIMQSTPKSLYKKKKETGFSRIRNKSGRALQNDSEHRVVDAKEGLREHLNKKLSTEKHPRQDSIFDVASSKDKGHRKQNEVDIPPSPSLGYVCDVQTEKANAQNDKVTSQTIALNDGEEIMELSTEQIHVLLNLFENHQDGSEPNLNNADCSSNAEDVSANTECLSPVTSTCNMLESLLRKPTIPSGNVSESSGLEDSTESQRGLR